MKYWFFDGNDVVGPFEPKELAARRGFAATSLVCPENFSEDQDSWRMAASFPDFHFNPSEVFSVLPPEPESSTDSFDEEMDTLLKERSPLGNLEDSPATESPSLEIPKKPAKPGPIEDYFNHIKGEDLGNILGIPDPNENSDMNLARALQTQFEKTNPPADKEVHPIEDDPFDEFTPKEEPEPQPEQQTPALHAAAEKTAPAAADPAPASIPISKTEAEDFVLTPHGKTSASKEKQPAQPTPAKQEAPAPQPEQESVQTTSQLPVLGQPETQLPPLPEQKIASFASSPQFNQTPEAAPAPAAEQKTISETESSQKEVPVKEDAQPEELVSASKQPEPADAAPSQATAPADTAPAEDPKEATVRHILEGKLEVSPTPEVLEPIKNVTVEPQVNHVRPRLKQTPEIQEFLNQTRNERIERERRNKKAMAALSVLIALLAVGAAAYINQKVMGPSAPAASTAPQTPPAVQPTPDAPADSGELLPDISVPPPPQTITEPSQENKALSLVQNYQLPGNKGTVAAYLSRLYRSQLSQGYSASWSVEPLHKSTYIVKYRLTKTRMEPVVYIFQADVAAGKLTGALNNITLDLVGKIQ